MTTPASGSSSQFRIDVLSDTHGRLPVEAWEQCAGADLIVHAGDICDAGVLDELELQAPVIAVLGNNDWPGEYGPRVQERATFERMGISFAVAHIPRQLGTPDTDIGICGHTHVPLIEHRGKLTVLNPGSTTRPRTSAGPTMARIILRPQEVASIEIIYLMHPA